MNKKNIGEKLYPERIAVVGAGVVGWTVAAALANGLIGLNTTIIVLDDNNYLDQCLPCSSATPAATLFNKMLGVDERHFIKQTQSAYSLAAFYRDLSGSDDYFMPFAEHGFMMHGIAFSNYASYLHVRGDLTTYDSYSLSAVAARLGRFRHPSANANSLLSTLEYGFQTNTENISTYWRNYAIDKGVEALTCEFKSVQLNETNGEISGINIVKASERDLVIADLYIDCTGAHEWLIGKSLGVKYDSLEKCLPTNRQCYTEVKIQKAGLPHITIMPAPSGFVKEVTTQSCKQLTYSYHTDFINDNDAATFLKKVGGDLSQKYSYLSVSTGKRSCFWNKNCIAIGRSAGYLQDFTIDQLHLVQSAILRLITLFPATTQYEINSKEYNRLTMLEYQHIIDFHQLHYKVLKKMTSSFWKYVSAIPETDTLRHRLQSFDSRGILPFYEGETLSHGTWVSFLLGFNHWPKAYDPMVDKYDERWITNQLLKMRTMMNDAAKTLPMHHEYIQKI